MSFEQLKNIIEFNREQETLAREEEITICPYCVWPLDVNSKGEKSCPICERYFR